MALFNSGSGKIGQGLLGKCMSDLTLQNGKGSATRLLGLEDLFQIQSELMQLLRKKPTHTVLSQLGLLEWPW